MYWYGEGRWDGVWVGIWLRLDLGHWSLGIIYRCWTQLHGHSQGQGVLLDSGQSHKMNIYRIFHLVTERSTLHLNDSIER